MGQHISTAYIQVLTVLLKQLFRHQHVCADSQYLCWLSVAPAAMKEHVAASNGSEFQISLLVKRF